MWDDPTWMFGRLDRFLNAKDSGAAR
jgi:hypothetical protein